MCGIVGALSLDPGRFRVTSGSLEPMRERMAHRGPDGAGLWLAPDGRIGLGHRRLAIIDLSDAALQPMANRDGTLRIVFNGEIYNHAEIRAELERSGRYRWQTDHSDTEVILHAFAEWGLDAVHRFRGMFAFAIWDAVKQELWLVRDRIGVKPLYYTRRPDRFLFASEIKALLADPSVPRAVDEAALFDFLSFLTTPAPATLFQGIAKLEAGCWLKVGADGQVTGGRWWDAWDEVVPLTGVSDAELAARILDELRCAVNLRKVSDVPTGVFLSGGIDSSTNLALFAEGEAAGVKAFSITYDDRQRGVADEMPFARLIARHTGAEHHERMVGQDDLLGFLERMVWLQDEPIADPVCVPVHFVSELARRHGVTVCQVGEGADELFCGYPAWRQALDLARLDRLPVPRLVKTAGAGLLTALGHGDRHYTELLRRAGAGRPIFWGGAEGFGERRKFALLSERLRRQFRGHSSWSALAPIRQDFLERAWEPSALNWMTYLDLRLRLPELLLMRVDKMSMGVGVEARVPFLDHRFVALALSIPTKAKTGNRELKRLLKQAVAGLLPREIIDRPKQGFAVPVADWMLSGLGEHMRETLRAFCRETDFLDGAAVELLLAGPQRAAAWPLFNFALWWRCHVAG
ncbi:MAG: asparagine synthase (glutamine-hydrolyzing) [Candidatus Hydrogenedens sp.]|nr:asparagine synthase (glutamine-hydrolyzing) [Candidatus Hydrogenedens sp.]